LIDHFDKPRFPTYGGSQGGARKVRGAAIDSGAPRFGEKVMGV